MIPAIPIMIYAIAKISVTIHLVIFLPPSPRIAKDTTARIPTVN